MKRHEDELARLQRINSICNTIFGTFIVTGVFFAAIVFPIMMRLEGF